MPKDSLGSWTDEYFILKMKNSSLYVFTEKHLWKTGTNPFKCFGTRSNQMYTFQNFGDSFHFLRPSCCLNRWRNSSGTQRQPSWAVATEIWILHILSNRNYEFRHRENPWNFKWRKDTKKTLFYTELKCCALSPRVKTSHLKNITSAVHRTW